MKLPISRAVAHMPADRDVAWGVIRSWSLIVVVFGHFLMSIVYWRPDHVPVTSDMLSSGYFWPYTTWFLQVMPLFFVAVNFLHAQGRGFPEPLRQAQPLVAVRVSSRRPAF